MLREVFYFSFAQFELSEVPGVVEILACPHTAASKKSSTKLKESIFNQIYRSLV